jgi:DNA polymerase III subunit delta
MPSAAPPSVSLLLVCGDDEFGVKERAKQVYHEWCDALGGMDHEIIDASAANSGEALKALSRLREALQTLPFFGSAKAVWFQNCNFLGEDRTASAAAVTENVSALASELARFKWDNIRLLISAGKVDKRRVFYKTVDKIGKIESLAGWSAQDRNWSDQAEIWARGALRARSKEISDDALGELVSNVGPNVRLLSNEVEKLALYSGTRPKITLQDVGAVVTRNKQARAFALGDALGDRNLPQALRCLDDELWEIKLDSQRSEIGLLYGLITKIRTLLFVKGLLSKRFLKPGSDYNGFKRQLDNIPPEAVSEDKRFSPLGVNTYVLFKAMPQTSRYTQEELIRAMELLLHCNQQLTSSRLERSLVLQQTIIQIVGSPSQPSAKGPQRHGAGTG